MALEYRLTLAGGTPITEIADRALPDVAERPTGTGAVLSADLFDRYGFTLAIRAGEHGYLDAMADNGDWEWEPEVYVSLTFRMDKFAEPDWNVVNMLTVVRRVLDSGPEDAAFIFNGDVLLLTRVSGVLVKHRRDDWWDSAANSALPG